MLIFDIYALVLIAVKLKSLIKLSLKFTLKENEHYSNQFKTYSKGEFYHWVYLLKNQFIKRF